jgi:opacity protein-like surface antigen
MKRINKNLIIRLAFCTALLLGSALLCSAQSPTPAEYPKFEFFAGYSALGETGSRVISLGPNASVGGDYQGQGFETSIIRNFNKHIGIKGDFSFHFNNESSRGPIAACTPTCTTVTQDFQLKTRVYNFLAGPEFKARNSTRFTPFVHALGGFAHTSATFTTPGPTHILFVRRNDTSFAMALGGGLDIRASNRVSFRAMMDYNPVFVNDSTVGTRDFVRFSVGVLFH